MSERKRERERERERERREREREIGREVTTETDSQRLGKTDTDMNI